MVHDLYTHESVKNIFSTVINKLRVFMLKNYSASYNVRCKIQFSIEILKIESHKSYYYYIHISHVVLYPQI